MKKIFNILLLAAATLGIASSCSDVPLPYDINADNSTSFGKKLPYKNASLSTFDTYDLKGHAAWSKGSNYTQATGYQDWDGTGSKSNVEVESYLISPALNLTCESGKVRLSFDETIRYSNNVSGWANNHKIYISKDYDGNTLHFEDATWDELKDFAPQASPYSDWTLYTSGYVNIPEDYVNHDSVYVAFYFYAPASGSTTWELENFLIEEGDASTITKPENAGTKQNPLSVETAKTAAGQKTYVTGYIVGYVNGTKLEEGATFAVAESDETELLLADSKDCTDPTQVFPVQLPVGELRTVLNPSNPQNIGAKVTVYGSLETYFGVTGMKSTSWARINDTEVGVDPDAAPIPAGEAKGTGTKEDPFNAQAAINYTSKLAADTNSEPVYIEGIVCDEPNIDTGSYGNATFHISDDGTANNQFYIFRTFDVNGAKFTDANKIKKGDKVVIYGPVVNYKGNTPETVANKASIVSINGVSEGGSTEEDDKPSAGSSEGLEINGTTVTLTNTTATPGSETISIDLSKLGYENAAAVVNVPLADGTVIVFEAGTNSNAPKYYTATNGVRVYANNIITFNGKSPIAKVVMECDEYSGTKYVGNETATISADGNKLVYVNASESAGTQLRVKTITITYAK